MSESQFRNEKMYQATMSIAKKLLSQGIISEEQYGVLDTIFTEKYAPSLGSLFADNRLI